MSRIQFHPLLAAAILALGACGGEAEQANDTNAADAALTENEAAALTNEAATPPPSAPGSAAALSADYMAGKWSAIDEDCSEVLEFREDGMVVTPIGEAKWTVAGDQLTIDYDDESTPTVSTIRLLGPDRIEITTASGRKETQKRC